MLCEDHYEVLESFFMLMGVAPNLAVYNYIYV